MSTNPNPKTDLKPANPKSRTRRPRRSFPARVKCEAVLALWAEQRKPGEICRELDIPWQQLQTWQKQALEAMLERLEPRKDPGQAPGLSPRLQKLLEKADRNHPAKNRLEKRLETIQTTQRKPPTKP